MFCANYSDILACHVYLGPGTCRGRALLSSALGQTDTFRIIRNISGMFIVNYRISCYSVSRVYMFYTAPKESSSNNRVLSGVYYSC